MAKTREQLLKVLVERVRVATLVRKQHDMIARATATVLNLREENEKLKNRAPPEKFIENLKTIAESELQCPICNELLVYPIDLNCSHTICYSCLVAWKNSAVSGGQNYVTCPVCRNTIVYANRAIATENFINKLVRILGPEYLEERLILVAERYPPPHDEP